MAEKNDPPDEEHEFFVRKRALGELFDSKFNLDVNLFRGRNPNNDSGVLYPILKSFKLSNGRVRQPDIRTYQKNGETWVDATSGGISLFDRKGVPVADWDYYLLALGTQIPYGLVITKDETSPRLRATHYTIRPHWDMPLVRFCVLLDELATKLTKA